MQTPTSDLLMEILDGTRLHLLLNTLQSEYGVECISIGLKKLIYKEEEINEYVMPKTELHAIFEIIGTNEHGKKITLIHDLDTKKEEGKNLLDELDWLGFYKEFNLVKFTDTKKELELESKHYAKEFQQYFNNFIAVSFPKEKHNTLSHVPKDLIIKNEQYIIETMTKPVCLS